MAEVRFNIEIFKINDYEDWYRHYLAFLIRYLFNSNNFSWTITKKEFISKWIENWFWERYLENIYQNWKNNNPFIREIRKKNRNQLIVMKSLFNKEQYNNYLVYIEGDILKRITDINIFRSFCYIVISCRPIRNEKIIKKKQYFNKNPSRLIWTIWKEFWWTEKSTMSKRLTKAKEIFWDIFNITNRYTYFRWFMAQISNLYSISWVRYINKRDKKKQKEYNNDIILNDSYKIKNKFINSSKEIFWEKPEQYKWFLNENLYQDLYLKIKEEVFNN